MKKLTPKQVEALAEDICYLAKVIWWCLLISGFILGILLIISGIVQGQPPLPDQSPSALLLRLTNRPPATNYWATYPFPKVNATNFYWLWRSTNGGKSWSQVASNLYQQGTNGDIWITNRQPSELFKLERHAFTPRRFLDDVPHPVMIATNLTLEVNGAKVVK